MEEVRLGVFISKQTRDLLRVQAKERGMLFGSYVSQVLEAKAKPQPKAVKVINPELQEVIDHFEKKIGKVHMTKSQTKFAQELLKAHGFNRVIGAINAASEAQGMEYAPTIASFKHLFEKWVSLESFYKRQRQGIAVIT